MIEDISERMTEHSKKPLWQRHQLLSTANCIHLLGAHSVGDHVSNTSVHLRDTDSPKRKS